MMAAGENIKSGIEGIYKITDGQEYFGNFAVVKFLRGHLSIFCEKNSSYFVLSSGFSDTSYFFKGFWRFSRNNSTGAADFSIAKSEGGYALYNGLQGQVILRGSFAKEDGGGIFPVRLEYQRALKQNQSFNIIAHRGGGRNTDRLQASENSLEILQLAEYFGANSVEIDVQLTKDKIPILFHDEEFTPRLVKGNYLIGSVSSFSFEQIRTFGRLLNDEKIPTLDEALDVILNKTSISLVWLDIKWADAIPIAAEIQKKYTDLALQKNRDLKILLGLPDDDVLNAYVELDGSEYHDAICELDLNSVRKSNARVWAPRWTDGIQKQQITTAQGEGRKVFVWTLDINEFISEFISTGYYDGFCTNYPSVVAYEYYMRNN
jgi:glycerophosphoryl diester phosphodiesterase